MAALQELAVDTNEEGLLSSAPVNAGYFFLMECVLHALRFELYHRKE